MAQSLTIPIVPVRQVPQKGPIPLRVALVVHPSPPAPRLIPEPHMTDDAVRRFDDLITGRLALNIVRINEWTV